MAKVVKGDILLAKEKYIVHQLNCFTKAAAGLAASIFQTFPYADVYKARQKPDKPGNIIVCGNGKDQRLIVGFLAQLYPGPPKKGDDAFIRQAYFNICLDQLATIPELESVAFPENVGCGLAAGDWKIYSAMIEKFAKKIQEEQGAETILYQRKQ